MHMAHAHAKQQHNWVSCGSQPPRARGARVRNAVAHATTTGAVGALSECSVAACRVPTAAGPLLLRQTGVAARTALRGGAAALPRGCAWLPAALSSAATQWGGAHPSCALAPLMASPQRVCTCSAALRCSQPVWKVVPRLALAADGSGRWGRACDGSGARCQSLSLG